MDLAWQCKCGSIEYSDMEPEECNSCGKIGKFAQLPSELVEERMKDSAEDLDLELSMEDEMVKEMGVKPTKLTKAKTSKPKLTKPKRRNKR
jgi:hypothetical protein